MLFTAIKLFSLSGLRSQKTVNSATTQFYYAGADTIDEAVGGQLYASNIRGIGPTYRSSGGHYYTFIRDGHGDVNKILDETGAEVSNYQYDAVRGEIKTGAQTNTLYNPYRYSGEYFDEESGLYYLRARYYSPEIARFITQDTYVGSLREPVTLNLYAYCGGNPIKFVDPSGHTLKIASDNPEIRNTFECLLEKLTDYDLFVDEQGFISIIGIPVKQDKPNGNKLIEDLINCSAVITIMYKKGKCGFKDNKIEFDPDYNIDVYVTDSKTGTNYLQKTESFINLGHELGHAWTYNYGDLNMKSVNYVFKIGEKSTIFFDKYTFKYPVFKVELFPFEEYYNLGLLPDENGNYFQFSENNLRKENFLKLRGA